jgi:hypothetical protein
MICYECNKLGKEVPAVALCRECQCGLCADHVRENAGNHERGGTFLGCQHDTWAIPRLSETR